MPAPEASSEWESQPVLLLASRVGTSHQNSCLTPRDACAAPTRNSSMYPETGRVGAAIEWALF